MARTQVAWRKRLPALVLAATPALAGCAHHTDGSFHDASTCARPPRDYKGWHIDITFVANPNKYSILQRKGPFVSLHPLVRVHPDTGEKALFFNPGTTTHIVGLRERESQAILDLLAEEVTRPEYQVRFHWTPNTIALWDNQATAHAGPIDYAHFDLPRVMRRITVAGDLREGPDGFRSQPLICELFGIIG